ncbi:Hist deacetyl domain containing protein [Trichuris trichiura]|uniref:Histone deacetylase 11 n=1 Tax=Trichuris trichiura TaxID=36087 RepID=A0A077ZCI9_TRITR|nr:Hist deacetyl domain containing protein [Trichuris trichiura]
MSNPTSSAIARCKASKLYDPIKKHGCHAFVYHPKYDISFYGIEKCHPFDSRKWGRICKQLLEKGYLDEKCILTPMEATKDDLLVVHTKGYLYSLKWSIVLVSILEVPLVLFFPACLINRKVLSRFRLQTGGTILASRVALEIGAAVNIGGGFHHCSASRGGGFCPYADITLSLKFLFINQLISKAMIVDLDAHQGNGHETDFKNDENVYILDMYNSGIYPYDLRSRRAIRKNIQLDFFTEDEEYLALLKNALTEATSEFKPDIVVYNAGTDCLVGDRLGCLSITAEGILKRDEIVFQTFRHASPAVPVVMVTSGGYQSNNAKVIADSLANLIDKGYLPRC